MSEVVKTQIQLSAKVGRILVLSDERFVDLCSVCSLLRGLKCAGLDSKRMMSHISASDRSCLLLSPWRPLSVQSENMQSSDEAD